jgi:hypothetical protein
MILFSRAYPLLHAGFAYVVLTLFAAPSIAFDIAYADRAFKKICTWGVC